MSTALLLTLLRRQARLERQVLSMAETLDVVQGKLIQLTADYQVLQQAVLDLTGGLQSQVSTLKEQLAAAQAQLADIPQAPDLTPLGDAADALDQSINNFKAQLTAPATPVPVPTPPVPDQPAPPAQPEQPATPPTSETAPA